MFHHTIEPSRADLPIHPAWCSCFDCRLRADPLTARRKRVVELQATALLAFLVVLYGLVLFFVPGIADAFGWRA